MEIRPESDHNGCADWNAADLGVGEATMGTFWTWAQAPALAKAPNTGWGILPLIAMIAALGVAMIITYRVVRDLKGGTNERLTDSDDLLNPLLQAYAAGEMSREEYLRARDAVVRAGYAGSGLDQTIADPPAAPEKPPLERGNGDASPEAGASAS